MSAINPTVRSRRGGPRRIGPWIAATLCAASAGGCAAVKPRASFPDVQADVAARVGKEVRWNDGTSADREVADGIARRLGLPLDIDSAVQIALLNNRRLQAAYEDLGVAQADLVQAGLLRNPVFDAAYQFGEGGLKAKIDLALTFDFIDLLFIGVRRDLAAAELESAKARVTAAVLDLAGEVHAAFYDVQATQQAVELRRQIAEATAASADLAKRLREAGNITALSQANEQALHVEAELNLDAADATAAAARERLCEAMGVWGGQTAWTVAGRLPEPAGDELPVDGLEKRAVEKSLDLRLGRAAIVTSLRNLGITVPLGLLSEFETGISTEREDGEWFTGPAVTLPLPVFSQGQPLAARAQARVRQAEANLYATAVGVRSNTRAIHARVRALRKRADGMRQTLLPLRQQVVRQTQLQYNAMQVGAFELLQAKRDQIETAATYLLVLRDYWTAKSGLDSALAGRLPRTASAVDLIETPGGTRVTTGTHD